jgi:hypothetical protein
MLGLAQRRAANALAEYRPAWDRQLNWHDLGHVTVSQKMRFRIAPMIM